MILDDDTHALGLGDKEGLSQSFFVYYEDAKTAKLGYHQGFPPKPSGHESDTQWIACGPTEKGGSDYRLYHGTSSKHGCHDAVILMQIHHFIKGKSSFDKKGIKEIKWKSHSNLLNLNTTFTNIQCFS